MRKMSPRNWKRNKKLLKRLMRRRLLVRKLRSKRPLKLKKKRRRSRLKLMPLLTKPRMPLLRFQEIRKDYLPMKNGLLLISEET